MNFFKKSLENVLIDMKLAQKQMKRESKKREAASKSSIKAVQKYLKEGKPEVAKIHAENAIREKNEATNFLLLASRIDAVAQRVQSAIAAKNLTKNMKKVVNGMSSVLKTMDVEKISNLMEQFEEDNETLDVRTKYMDTAVSNTVSGATPEGQVTELMQQAADEVGIRYLTELEEQVPSGEPQKDASLEGRMKALNENNQT